MADRWYAFDGDGTWGPFPAAVLRKKIATGEFPPDVRVSQEGDEGWREASVVGELAIAIDPSVPADARTGLAPPAASPWYVFDGLDTSGPFAEADLRARLADGELDPSTQVSREGDSSWRPAADFPELRSLTNPEPPLRTGHRVDADARHGEDGPGGAGAEQGPEQVPGVKVVASEPTAPRARRLPSGWVVGAVSLGLAIVSTAGVFLARRHAGNRDEPEAVAATATQAPAAQLPGPFAAVRIGTTAAELAVLFPGVEDLKDCAPTLVGGTALLPPQVPGSDKKPRAQCARPAELAGLTSGESAAQEAWITKVQEWAATRRTGDLADYRAGHTLSVAQVRATIRAGAVSEAALLEAASGRSPTAYGAVSVVSGELRQGGVQFATAGTSRRELCALISESCDDLDPGRVRTYVQGGYSLGQIDADAHSRVVYGACRNAFLRGEKKLALKLSSRAGAFGGIGLARATQKTRKLDPNAPATFAVYSARSKLTQTVARFGVLLANALPVAESYWKGAIALFPGSETKSDWSSAIVWLKDGRVIRVMVNVWTDERLGDLPPALSSLYGAGGSTRGTVTTWTLPGGITATLDIGAMTGLLVESPALAPSLPPAVSSSPAAEIKPPAAAD